MFHLENFSNRKNQLMILVFWLILSLFYPNSNLFSQTCVGRGACGLEDSNCTTAANYIGTSSDLLDFDIKCVDVVFHVIQQSTANPMNFENISAHTDFLEEMVYNTSYGANTIFRNNCHSDPNLTDTKIRLNLRNIHFWQDINWWDQTHYNRGIGAACDLYDEFVTNNTALPTADVNAVHVFFVEYTDNGGGSITPSPGAIAAANAPVSGQNAILFSGQLNDNYPTDPQGGALAHEISLLFGEQHDHSNISNVMGHTAIGFGNTRCRFTLEHLSTIHYYLDGNCKTNGCPTISQTVKPLEQGSGGTAIVSTGSTPPPGATPQTLTNPFFFSGGNYVTVDVTEVGAISYKWEKTGGSGFFYPSTNGSTTVYVTPGQHVKMEITIEFNDRCPIFWELYLINTSSSFTTYSLSPNPANDQITIQLHEEPEDKAVENNIESSFETGISNLNGSEFIQRKRDTAIQRIQILDPLSNRVIIEKSLPVGSKSVNIDISFLKHGSYVARIFSDGQGIPTSLKFIK